MHFGDGFEPDQRRLSSHSLQSDSAAQRCPTINLLGELQMKANVLNTLRNLHNDESGQDLIEYALIAGLIALAAVTTMGTLGTAINTAFGKITTALNSAG
jgi:pilus assembly protein Flp/PilA